MSDSRNPRLPPPLADAAAAAPSSTGTELLSSLLDSPAFVGHAPSSAAPGACLTGVCIDERHPSVVGRVRIRWKMAETVGDAWLPALQSVVVRTGDRVLLSQPLNEPEPIVVGVIDGFAHRPSAPRNSAAQLVLRDDEVMRVEDARGRPLLELRAAEGGPVVRLVRNHVAIEVDGKLAFSAAAIRLEARQGTIEIEAADDVCVKGEVVHLN
jgi:hypothetical protein